ncbi:MAG: hypothetical protein QOG85_289 [Gaiellaceae bacterium]|jgi:hypothetical protein|nr:hypothetical protein [Gaiellaceae bacterium]
MLRPVFNVLSSLLFLAVVIQVGLAGYGVFDALHKAKSGPVTKEMIENGFDPHGLVGTAVLGLMVLLVLAAAAGRLGQTWLTWSVGLLVLGVIQMILGVVSPSLPWLGFVHGINALAIYAGAALLAHRAWTRKKHAPAPAE